MDTNGVSAGLPGRKFLVGDIGATYTRLAIGESTGRIEETRIFRTPKKDRLDVARLIIDYYKNIGVRFEIEAIGISTIGPIDLRKGWVVDAPNHPLRSFPLREPIEKETGLPVIVANDCVASVWGEYLFGKYRGTRDMVYVTLSTGVGAGFIVDGNLLVGWRGNAHEAGHIVVSYNDYVSCGCGGLGHLEALVSGARFPNYAKIRSESYDGNKTLLYMRARGGSLNIEEFFRGVRGKDEFAVWLYRDYIKAMAAGIASIASLMDPQVMILGGGILLNNEDILINDLVSIMPKYYLYEKLPLIATATWREFTGLYGALAIVSETPKPILEKSSIRA